MALEPIDVSGVVTGELPLHQLREQIHAALLALRETHPQLTNHSKQLEATANRLADEVHREMLAPGASYASLLRRLRGLRIKGLGAANEVWQSLFFVSPAPAPVNMRYNLPMCSRAELLGIVRAVWGGHFAGMVGCLEWVFAAIAAWRPESLRDLHACIRRVHPQFPEFRQFSLLFGHTFAFDYNVDQRASRNASPDWSRLWEYEAESGYGLGLPNDVTEFLSSFMSDVKARNADARILDIGTGAHAATLLARVVSSTFEIHGVDIAKVPPLPPGAGIQVHRMNVEKLGFADGSFVAVTSVNGVEYANPQLALPEIRRVLKLGGEGAFVLHRPDSLVLERARRFVRFIHDTRILETLALAWLYLHEGGRNLERQLLKHLFSLKSYRVDDHFVRYFRRVLVGIPEAIQLGQTDPNSGFGLIERFESDLIWTYQRDQFLMEHMTFIPVDQVRLVQWLAGFGFQVSLVQQVYLDADRGRPPLGWAVRLKKL